MKMMIHVSFFVCLLCVALVNAKLNRIVGGDEAPSDQFKYQISLQKNNKNACGGAIIADQYVLTAAHCVVKEDGKFRLNNFQIVAGSTNLLTNEGVRIDVEEIYVPIEYSPVDVSNDIAVLKLRRSLCLDSDSNLQKVNLPPRRESSHVDDTAAISGFGYTYVETKFDQKTRKWYRYNGGSDRKLRYCMVNIISNQECIEKAHLCKITENHICGHAVQREQQQTGICMGDSGGPLVIGNVVIGIASTCPLDCTEHEYPSVYTRVSSFIDFITKAMEGVKSSDMLVRESLSGESSSCRKWPFQGCISL